MKFVHIADMHLDASFSNLSSKNDFGKKRRLDQREILKKIIKYIQENKIEFLFISGDLYENQYIKKSTIEYINELFKTIPNTKIYITPGNHDPYLKNSMYNNFDWNENVKIFSSKIEKVELDEVDIYGVGFDDFYASTLNVENIEIENKDKLNILITHGSLNASDKLQLQYNPLNKNKLKSLGFDYIALGHIHKLDYNSEPNQRIVYPGSSLAMGFDELGEHGFIVGNLTKEKLELEFIPVDNKEFKELEFNVTDINDFEELIEKINELMLDENKFYKIILTGKRKFEINLLELNKFITIENIIKIKDKTELNYTIEELVDNNTLKGLFVQELLNEMKNENYTQDEIDKILEIGLSALEGKK